MNSSLILTILIVVLTGLLAWFQHGRITTLEEEHRTLVQRATVLGLSVDGLPPTKSGGAAASGGTAIGSASRSKATAQDFTVELIAFMKEMKRWQKAGEEPPAETQREAMAFFQRFLELDADVMAHLVEELRATTELEESEKTEVMRITFMAMVQSSPETALDLFVGSKEMMGELRDTKHMVQMALGSWAAKDPEAALAWLDLNGAALPEGAAQEAQKTAVAAVFGTDPELALRLALELDREAIGEIGGNLANYIRNPDDQLQVLRTLKEQLGDLPTPGDLSDPENASKEELLRGGIVSGLATALGRQSFAEASDFLERAELSAKEESHLATQMTNQAWTMTNPGDWLPWIEEHSGPGTKKDNVRKLVTHWTGTDFRATAAWIGDQADGPLREEATYAFASKVAPHEPESAAEWAEALPDSGERTELLSRIHTQWKKRDEAAAAAFAAKHSLPDR